MSLLIVTDGATEGEGQVPMKLVVEAVRSKQMGYKAASKHYSVPRSTLKDYV